MKRLFQHTTVTGSLAALLLLGGLTACDKKATDYRDFLNGKETVYPGLMRNMQAMPGKERVRFSWQPSADPSIKTYRITWNFGQNTLDVPATTQDPTQTITALAPGLLEDTYDFKVYALDGAGNKSVPAGISGVRIYGARYESSLNNRGIISKWFEGDQTLVIKWATADTVHTGSRIAYTDVNGVKKTLEVSPDAWETRVPECKAGEVVSVLSGYKPVAVAIDTFYALKPDTLRF